MTTTALSLRSPALRTLTALAFLAPAAVGCIGSESAGDEAPDATEAAIDTGKVYHLVSVHSGLAIDVAEWSKSDGAKIQQWQYGHQGNQQWTLKDAGGGAFTVVSVNSGKCLDVADRSTADGARIQQWSCRGGRPLGPAG